MSTTEPDETAESAGETDALDTSESEDGGEEVIFAVPLATDLVFGSGMVIKPIHRDMSPSEFVAYQRGKPLANEGVEFDPESFEGKPEWSNRSYRAAWSAHHGDEENHVRGYD